MEMKNFSKTICFTYSKSETNRIWKKFLNGANYLIMNKKIGEGGFPLLHGRCKFFPIFKSE